ncbi:MAG: hypothetical protein WCK05_00325 [Planctomycetota bacterium]
MDFTVTEFDPSARNELYELFSPAWRANRDFAEMHEHVLRGGEYLDRFGQGTNTPEPAGQYQWRKDASFAMDYCSDLVDLRVGNLFRTQPVRIWEDSPYAEFIAGFVSDVDGAGTTMDAFMRRALREYYVNGVDIVVDKTAAAQSASPVTLADERSLAIRPTLTALTPLERVDWACDSAGRYCWVRYDLGAEPAVDETAGGGPRQYLTLTADQWRLYRRGGGSSPKATVAAGPMGLGVVPVVSFYYGESIRPDWRKVPLSLLTRIVPLARAMLNLVSQGQLDLYMAIGVLAALGVEAEQLPTELSPMCWLALPEGAAVQHIRPAVEHVAEKRQWLALMTEAMLRMGKVYMPPGEGRSRAGSGVQVQVERTDLDNEMAATAGAAEQAERDIIRLAVSRHEGRLIGHEQIGYSVEYNRQYVLASVREILEQARGFTDLSVTAAVPDLARVFLRRVLDQLMKKDDPRYKAIAEQIRGAELATRSNRQ